MNFFGDKRLWYAIFAVIVVVIVAAVFWPRNQTMEPSVPAPPATCLLAMVGVGGGVT